MVRSVTFAVALALGTVSIPAHALGLGDIKAKSALNQEFRADIDLLSVAAGELDGVRVRLASPEEFKKAGIERPFFLTLLKFRPTRLKNGKTVIQVSSDFPIREPFLDFLVEVNWPKGRLIREYTVLLDPPVTTRRRAPKVSAAPAAAATSRAAPQRTASRRPVVQAGKGEYGPVASNETLWSIAKRLRPRGVSMEQMMIALLRANPDAFIDGDINRLRRGQVLRVPSSDEILSISRAEAHRAYKEAQEQWLNRRAARLQAQAGAAAAKGGKGAGGAAAAEEKSELRIATARPEGEGEAGASEDRGDGETIEEIKRKLLIARENAESSRLESEALRKEIEELRKRLADMQRLLVLKDEQLARLQAQTGQVIEPTEEESELSALESVMQEADKAAAARQAEEEAAKAAAGGQAEAGGETPAAEGETAEGGETAPAEGEEKTPVVEGATGEEAPAAEGAAEEATAGEETLIVEEEGGAEEAPVVEDELAAAADAVLDEGAAEAQAPAAESAPAPQPGAPTEAPTAEKEEAAPAPAPAPEAPAAEKPEAPKPAAPAPAAPEAEAPAEGGFDPLRFVQDNLPLVAGAGGVLALLLILLGLRRRSGGEEAAEETLAEATGMDQAKAEDDDIAGITEDSQLSHDEETSMLSEFSPSDVNALRDETGEVDPVAEADVYIAYGRYQQAEDLLKQAMERDPDRLALKHKLLEVYYATRNVAAFNELAQGMVENGQDIVDQDAWARAREMGRELDPENSLYAEEGAAPAVVPVPEDVDAEAGSELETEISELADEFDDELSDLAAGEDLGESIDEPSLDLDDLKELEDLEHLDSEVNPLEDLESLDLELPSAEPDAAARPSQEPDDSLELPTLDLSGGEETPSESVDIDLEGQLEQLSDLSSLEGDLSRLTEDLDVPSQAASPAEADEGGLDQPIKLDEAFEKGLDSDVDLDLESLGSSNIDAEAIETKLDLAKAFLDMGDGEGARDILEEIRQEGNDAQREEAEKLLAEIG